MKIAYGLLQYFDGVQHGAYSSVAPLAEKPAGLAGQFVVVDMKSLDPGAGAVGSANAASAALLGKHLTVSAVGQTKPDLKLYVGLAVWVLSAPLAIVGGVLLGIISVSRHDGGFLAILAPVLVTVLAVPMVVKVGQRLELATSSTLFLFHPPYVGGFIERTK